MPILTHLQHVLLTQHLCHRQDVIQGQFLDRVNLTWIQNFPFPWLIAMPELKSQTIDELKIEYQCSCLNPLDLHHLKWNSEPCGFFLVYVIITRLLRSTGSVMVVFTQTLCYKQDATQAQCLSRVKLVWILNFPPAWLVPKPRLKNPASPNIYP